MRIKYFDYDDFISRMISDDIDVETKHISDECQCSIRLVQKWCKNNNVEYHRIKGIKHFILDWEIIEKFGEWYNRKLNKPKKSYYKPKPKKPPKPKVVKEKKTISFTTIKDIVDEVKIYHRYDKQRMYDTKIKHIQRWCKKNKIPFEYFNGRKYYVIDKKTKSRIIESFKKPDFLYYK